MATQDHSEAKGIGFAELIKWRIDKWQKEGNQSLKVLVAGRVGAGKSALVNGLIGREVAEEGDSARSVTHSVKKYKKPVNGVNVTIIDTPGFFDPEVQRDLETLREISQQTEGTIDLLLICLKMNERIDQTHVVIVEKLKHVFETDTVWQNSLLVLTFANEVCLPRTRRNIGAPPQPEDKESKLKDHFEKKLSEFRKELPKYLKDQIPAHLLKEIPIVPAGYDEPNLPGYDDWLSKFWVQAFKRTSESGRIALMRISEDRFIENPSIELLPPHLRPISMKVASGAIVGAAMGKIVGKIKEVFSHDEIEVIRRECEKKGASLGARFVLCFYKLRTPLDYGLELVLDRALDGFTL